MPRGKKTSSQDVIVPLVRHLLNLGEKIIIFRNARGPASGCAKYLARELEYRRLRMSLTHSQNDPSVMSQSLREVLQGGIAFHNSDLTRDDRVAMEREFRSPNGPIEVLVATSTVAAGINTLASTVIIAETVFFGKQRTPYTVAQYKNMAGRAGRLGFEAEGKSILLAENSLDRGQLFRRYVQGQPEPITSSLDPRQPGTWVMRLLAQVREVPRDAVIDLVANTYGGFLASLKNPIWKERMSNVLEGLLNGVIADELIVQESETLSLTMLGRACGESPLTLESAIRLVELLRRRDSRRRAKRRASTATRSKPTLWPFYYFRITPPG